MVRTALRVIAVLAAVALSAMPDWVTKSPSLDGAVVVSLPAVALDKKPAAAVAKAFLKANKLL